jgi:hypothetical protein
MKGTKVYHTVEINALKYTFYWKWVREPGE